jgi:pimeloyl-ACP methyl ester carboxylesterase
VTIPAAAPATLPPGGLPGLDPGWSRLVSARDSSGDNRTWHVLDNRVEQPTLTVLCVHGNPTWSYLWRGMLAAAPPGVRVIAVDHLDMGFSERTGTVRRLTRRIDDLDAVTAALQLDGPVVTVAHDWGGPISLGWAGRHRDQVKGIVLMNTAVHHPEGSPAPALIRLARSAPLLKTIAARTSGVHQRNPSACPPHSVHRDQAGLSSSVRGTGQAASDCRLRRRHPAGGGPPEPSRPRQRCRRRRPDERRARAAALGGKGPGVFRPLSPRLPDPVAECRGPSLPARRASHPGGCRHCHSDLPVVGAPRHERGRPRKWLRGSRCGPGSNDCEIRVKPQ